MLRKIHYCYIISSIIKELKHSGTYKLGGIAAHSQKFIFGGEQKWSCND